MRRVITHDACLYVGQGQRLWQRQLLVSRRCVKSTSANNRQSPIQSTTRSGRSAKSPLPRALVKTKSTSHGVSTGGLFHNPQGSFLDWDFGRWAVFAVSWAVKWRHASFFLKLGGETPLSHQWQNNHTFTRTKTAILFERDLVVHRFSSYLPLWSFRGNSAPATGSIKHCTETTSVGFQKWEFPATGNTQGQGKLICFSSFESQVVDQTAELVWCWIPNSLRCFGGKHHRTGYEWKYAWKMGRHDLGWKSQQVGQHHVNLLWASQMNRSRCLSGQPDNWPSCPLIRPLSPTTAHSEVAIWQSYEEFDLWQKLLGKSFCFIHVSK